ncbi:MAG TPA: BTAD domain-containing putative transcriptional regulator [Gemmatimonadales bacterium]|nr:BTAD domain-containing putative transcriptional regulator [Gemmatimonadales bacterium]
MVEAPTGPAGGAAAQRKSLALLALLAGSERGMSRDKILGYLWPDADAAKASHRLTQVLYALRRDLDADGLFLGSSDLRLNRDLISCDVHEFTSTRQAGDLERAVALYAGPFLDGFFLNDAPEFERWMENERAGYARECAEAIETLAAKAGAGGDHRRAAAWWQHLAEQDPLSSRVTIHLMSALAAGGSRADAIEQARVYQELIRRELDADPNPAVVALAEQLRRSPPRAGFALQPAQPPRRSIAVLPFANLSPVPTNDYFAEGLAEELMSALARLSDMRVAARSSVNALKHRALDAREIGRRLSVSVLIEGSIRQAGGRVRLAAQLVNAEDGCQLWSERYERPAENVFAVQDELAGLIAKAVEARLAAR